MSAERLESCSSKRACKENDVLEKRIHLRSESSASETEGLIRNPKRPKNLPDDNDGIQPNVTCQSELTSDCNTNLEPGVDLDLCSNTSICSFCKSSKTSEVIYMILALFFLFVHYVFCSVLLLCISLTILLTSFRLLGQCCIILKMENR